MFIRQHYFSVKLEGEFLDIFFCKGSETFTFLCEIFYKNKNIGKKQRLSGNLTIFLLNHNYFCYLIVISLIPNSECEVGKNLVKVLPVSKTSKTSVQSYNFVDKIIMTTLPFVF